MSVARSSALLLGAALAGCSPSPAEGGLELIGFRQNGFTGVALNEELVFHFSEELDPGSITGGSVRILDELGQSATGSLRARGNALSFLPDLPRTTALTDGGFRPATSYRVELGGFPRPDGIRSREGALLSATLLLDFRTAEPRGEHPLFLDPFTGPNPLLPVSTDIGPDDPIQLECREALDPTTVSSEHFVLQHARQTRGREPSFEELPLEVELLENRRDHALLELRPRIDIARGRFLQPDETYYLSLRPGNLKTLGGREVTSVWRNPPFLVVRVRLGKLEEDFRSTRRRSDELPPGCDGTALWGPGTTEEDRDEQDLRLRFPAAAGSGVHGEIELRAVQDLPGDLGEAGTARAVRMEASRLTVPAEAAVDLGGFEGPLVLCSQTSLEVAGLLQRRGVKESAENLARELEGLSSRTAEKDWPALSVWLERALASGEPWTILVAGGDLRVPETGVIDLDGPLMLIAGGSIRVAGHVYAREVWKTSEGTGNIEARPPPRAGTDPRPGVRKVPLRIDPPATNPLRATLRVGALSRALPLPRGITGWNPALLDGHPGIGRMGLRLLGRRGGSSDAGATLWQPLSTLEGPDEMRFLIELEIPPGSGEAWDPPRLEQLVLSWDESSDPAERSGETLPP